MNEFIKFLNNVSEISKHAQSDLLGCLQSFHYRKGQTVLNEGQVCNYLFFVSSGILRLFYVRNGRQITDYFASEGNLIGGIESFFNRQPTRKIIEAIEPCELIGISFHHLEALYQKHHDVERVGRLLLVHAFLAMQERVFAIQFHSARQRYQQLLADNPDILNRVSLGYIASFLGITQVTLSRIRAER